MILNKQVRELLALHDEDYKHWCRQNKRPKYNKESKRKFFEEIIKQRVVVMKNENDNLH